MDENVAKFLEERLGAEQYAKLSKISNGKLYDFIVHFIKLLDPASVFVCDDSARDLSYISEKAIREGEEQRLAMNGHTLHFDSPLDQGRDKEHTNILVDPGEEMGPQISTRDRTAGLTDINEVMDGIMRGREMLVVFATLGPNGSVFAIPGVQLTDSPYVAHSEKLLYRPGYEEFVRQGENARFFKFVHSEGELTENKTTKNIDKRRIYIDLKDDIVYSANTQYAGNTLGMKKMAMRLAIHRGSQEGWLCEHMLVMGVHGPNGRVTYFTGAFPSMCGKTSTAMLDGESVVGDDIAYLRKVDGIVRAVNCEHGMFGIILGVNSKDDPIQWKALHAPGHQIIFSNVLRTDDGGVYWDGKDVPVPEHGVNFKGEWKPGMLDATGKPVPPSHANARFTLSLDMLENLDKNADNPDGVEVSAYVYGGRDSDTWVPVQESIDWAHGIVAYGASIESETTAATIGKAGVRQHNPMSNLDFLSIPLGKYLQINVDFGKGATRLPRIFGVNYFLKSRDGKFLNGKNDKKVWYKWMELRCNGDVKAIRTATGWIPEYKDLVPLFKDVIGREYTQEEYEAEFSLRIPENISKIDRVIESWKSSTQDTPEVLFTELEAQRARLLDAQKTFGDEVKPSQWGIIG
jgi:phosphoenolpyruvate carboxykinase (GTP)